jgi:CheY-like chemotaxis protein
MGGLRPVLRRLQDPGSPLFITAEQEGPGERPAAELDAAVLDINLAGTSAYPVARVLRARGIPVIFATGYGQGMLSPDFKSHVVLTKPFPQEDFNEAVNAALPASPASE